MSDFPELGEQDCKVHNAIAKGVNGRLKAVENTLYDDVSGHTRIIPVMRSQYKSILVLLTGVWITVIGGIITILLTGGTK